MGSGAGKFCEGGLVSLKTCNPSTVTEGCVAVVKTDCEWNGWTSSACSVTCGRGDIYKKRTIKVHAAFGGNPCTGPETLVAPCEGLQPCPANAAVDCKWASWSTWSACSECGGQRKRFRDIQAAPQYGGEKCVATDTSQTEGCLGKEYCTTTYCVWGSWSSWGSCTRKCDTGKRKRRRELKETATAPKDDEDSKAQRLFNTYQELQQQIQDKSGQRWQELVTAFGGGCLSFVVLASAMRFWTTRIRCAAPAGTILSALPVDHEQDQLLAMDAGAPATTGYSPLGLPDDQELAVE